MNKRAKIKVLNIYQKKIKTSRKTISDLIDTMVPDMYEFTTEYIGTNIIDEIKKLCPQIVFLWQCKSEYMLDLIKKIKEIDPLIAIFVFVPDSVDNEQELIDEYMSAGAYKCLFSTISFDSLIHDMYVALNLE